MAFITSSRSWPKRMGNSQLSCPDNGERGAMPRERCRGRMRKTRRDEMAGKSDDWRGHSRIHLASVRMMTMNESSAIDTQRHASILPFPLFPHGKPLMSSPSLVEALVFAVPPQRMRSSLLSFCPSNQNPKNAPLLARTKWPAELGLDSGLAPPFWRRSGSTRHPSSALADWIMGCVIDGGQAGLFSSFF